MLAVSVEGSGYTSDIYRDVVSSFDVLQRGNVSVLSQRCLVQPVEPDYGTYISMGEQQRGGRGAAGVGGGVTASTLCPPPPFPCRDPVWHLLLHRAVRQPRGTAATRGVCRVLPDP